MKGGASGGGGGEEAGIALVGVHSDFPRYTEERALASKLLYLLITFQGGLEGFKPPIAETIPTVFKDKDKGCKKILWEPPIFSLDPLVLLPIRYDMILFIVNRLVWTR